MSIELKSSWTEEFSYDESIQILTNLARRHVKKSGRFRADLETLLDRRDWTGLCDYELRYLPSDRVDHLMEARQALAFFTKLEPLEIPGVNKERVAYQKFIRSEELCKETNETFRAIREGRFCLRPRVNAVLHGAARKISRILGPVPSLSQLPMVYGPGANTSVKASVACPRVKLGANAVCSTPAMQSVTALLAEFPLYARLLAMRRFNRIQQDLSRDEQIGYLLKVEAGIYEVDVTCQPGKLQFVPKNAKTYRSIVVEPILNTLAQKGLGSWMRRRLRMCGVNLDDQSFNQRLAAHGSITNYHATIDLSSASDTVSMEIVEELLPYDWVSMLRQFRTSKVRYRKKTFELEKFSSMGNAFTFELETVIFYSLAFAVCEHLQLPTGWVNSYGDDIVVPREAYPLLYETLTACGFLVNREKSFVDGPFRESCGKDFFLGIDIRPYYQKELVSNATLFTLHNYFKRRFDDNAAERVRKWIHPAVAIFGPDGFGDGHLIGAWTPRRKPKFAERGWEGSVFDTYTLKAKRLVKKPYPGDRILPLYTTYVAGEGSGLSGRGGNLHRFVDLPIPSDGYVVRGNRGYHRVSIYTLGSL